MTSDPRSVSSGGQKSLLSSKPMESSIVRALPLGSPATSGRRTKEDVLSSFTTMGILNRGWSTREPLCGAVRRASLSRTGMLSATTIV